MEEIYYCKVAGGGAPRKPHATRESAETEAQRLHAKCVGTRRVEILQVVSAIEALPGSAVPTAAIPPEPTPKKLVTVAPTKKTLIVVKKSRPLAPM